MSVNSEQSNYASGGILRGWHLDKRFHIGNIFTFVVLAITFAVYITSVEHKADNALERVESIRLVTEKELARERQARREADQRIVNRIERYDTRINNRLEQIHQSLIRIEEKMYKEGNKK